MIKIIPTEPRCGECTACCEITGFTGGWAFADIYNEAKDFGVVYNEWSSCNKLCESGCSIQTNKPRVCNEFFCHFIEHNLEDKYRPKEFGFVGYTDSNNRTKLMALDQTLPPETQYDNNKEMIDSLIELVRKSRSEEYSFASLHTKNGHKRIR
jgi:hypothetical protein